jgi:ABC-type uncharacterized transport system involved in gliding motility auxiliary subunit
LLVKYGLKVNDDLVILNKDNSSIAMVGRNSAIWSEFDQFNPVSKDFALRNVRLLIPNTRTVSTEASNERQMKADVVGETAANMEKIGGVRSKSDLQNVNSGRIETGKFGVLAVAAGRVAKTKLAEKGAEDLDKKDVAASKVNEVGEKEIRIVVAGSSQFANNAGVQNAENKDLFVNISNYLMQDESLISIRPKDIKKGSIEISSAGSQISLAFLVFLYPFVFLGGGLLYWLVRRRA